jgi:hypothetical protein
MTDIPIACSLTPAEYRRRTAGLGALANERLLSREPIPGGCRLTFAYTPELDRRLSDAVAAEAECCPFLTFALTRHAERLRLEVTGAQLAQPIIDDLFAVTDSAA